MRQGCEDGPAICVFCSSRSHGRSCSKRSPISISNLFPGWHSSEPCPDIGSSRLPFPDSAPFAMGNRRTRCSLLAQSASMYSRSRSDFIAAADHSQSPSLRPRPKPAWLGRISPLIGRQGREAQGARGVAGRNVLLAGKALTAQCAAISFITFHYVHVSSL